MTTPAVTGSVDLTFLVNAKPATWRVPCRGGWAHGEIWIHPIGWEFRVYRDGELQRSQACRTLSEAQQDADATRVRLEAHGAPPADA